ncbi:hypothetical protein N7463_000652 [Penicillium fimorum]|uniref:Uncharacterized protein n=1 Tax=Penicillium fimorum TaxID=1882269 RepID=A0A9X0CBA6_9EURO|nr:hypothetical protein N7463_000652 [Penicillium fimorum]
MVLAQVMVHIKAPVDQFMTPFAVNESSEIILWNAWTELRGGRLLDHAIYIISDIDQCDRAEWLLVQLLSFMDCSDLPGKFIISTTSPQGQKIFEMFSGRNKVQITSLEDVFSASDKPLGDETLAGMPTEFERDLGELLQQRPHLYPAQSTIPAALEQSAQDRTLQYAILNWLRYTRRPCTAIKTDLQPGQCGTLALFLTTVLGLVPENLQQWAYKVLAWLLSSFRSLSIAELETVSNLASGSDHSVEDRSVDGSPEAHNPPSLFLQYFSTLVVIENAEMCLIPIPEQVATAGSWYHYPTNALRHRLITHMSLDYLRLDSVQLKLLDAAKVHGTFRWHNAESTLLSYTVRYWPDHYKLASHGSYPRVLINEAISFLEDPALCQLWRLAYMSIAGRDIAEEQDSKSPLAAAASVGLQNVLDYFIQEQEPDSGELAGAITEAARNNSVQALQMLLKARNTVGVDTVNAATQASKFNPNGSVLLALLRYQDSKDLSDISVAEMLRGVCIFGLNDVMQYLIESNALSARPSLTAEILPLHLAARFNTIDIAQQLCDAGIDPMAIDSNGSTALHMTALYSSLGVVDILLQASGDIMSARNKANLSALQVACQAGSHSVAQRLIQAKGLMDYADDDDHPLFLAVREGHKVCV